MTGREIYLITILKLKFCEIMPIWTDSSKEDALKKKIEGEGEKALNKTKWQEAKDNARPI